MQFVTTAATAVPWSAETPTLFLGGWCLRPSERARWESLPRDVLPYHWDDRAKLARDVRTIYAAYERALAALTESLGRVHRDRRSPRAWRILLGPWLGYFTGVVFDRLASLEQAERDGRVTGTTIIEPLVERAAQDFTDFSRAITGDAWNHVLYGDLIRLRNRFAHDVRQGPALAPSKSEAWGRALIRSLVQRARLARYHVATHGRDAVFFLDAYFPPMERAALNGAIGQIDQPFPVALPPVAMPNVNAALRSGLKLDLGDSAFDVSLATLIPRYLPIAYLEGFARLAASSRRIFPKGPRTVVTANAYAANERFKAWIGERVDAGTRLDIVQHGGNIGAASFEMLEQHQVAIADRFFSWGWESAASNVERAPATKLLGIGERAAADPSGDVMLALGALPRYAYRLFSAPIATQYEAYLADQIAFLSALPAAVRANTRVIYAPDAFGWDVVERFRAAGLEDRLEACSDFQGRLRRARLCLSTFNTTTMLETMVADVPTLLFWNPRHWELRPSAEAPYQALRDAEILHDTPAAAAKKLEAVYADPNRWWQSVRVTRDAFVQRFAYTGGDWLAEWRALLG